MEQKHKGLSRAAKAGWFLLGFFIPIAGLILWLVWKNDEPEKSVWCRNGFILSLIIWIASFLLMFAAALWLSYGFNPEHFTVY